MLCLQVTEYYVTAKEIKSTVSDFKETALFRIEHRRESTNRLAITTFWRTFHHDGKFSPSW